MQGVLGICHLYKRHAVEGSLGRRNSTASSSFVCAGIAFFLTFFSCFIMMLLFKVFMSPSIISDDPSLFTAKTHNFSILKLKHKLFAFK